MSPLAPDTNVAPPAGELVPSSPSAAPLATGGDLPLPLDGAASCPVPPGTGPDIVPRRSAWGPVPAPSWEETNDGLVRGTATSQALAQVHEAASQHKGELANILDSSLDAPVKEDPCMITTGDTSKEMTIDSRLFDDITFLIDVEDPDAPKWPDALKSDKRDKWLEGAKIELNGLHLMKVYELILRHDIPSNCSVLCGKFVCHLKCNAHGNLVCHKVCWVAKGFQQVWGRDFSKTTSPMAHLESLRIVLHIAAVKDWCIKQYDVKTAFLNGILPEDEIQYMEQPPGFAELDKQTYVWRLLRSLYGMRQSSHTWNCALHTLFLSWGFSRSKCEWCVYSHCSDNSEVSIVVVHIDDMATILSSRAEADRFRAELESSWEITTLGEPKLIVGIAICRD